MVDPFADGERPYVGDHEFGRRRAGCKPFRVYSRLYEEELVSRYSASD
jgi:hypothetical protein